MDVVLALIVCIGFFLTMIVVLVLRDLANISEQLSGLEVLFLVFSTQLLIVTLASIGMTVAQWSRPEGVDTIWLVLVLSWPAAIVVTFIAPWRPRE